MNIQASRPSARRAALSTAASLLAGVLATAGGALADEILPSPAVGPIPVAKDLPYLGPIRIRVDASDVTRGVFSVTETIPVRPGAMVLLIPKWQQGAHSIQAPVANIAGIQITADGKAVPWRRNPAEVYAIHLDVPDGVGRIDLAFDYLSPTSPEQGRVAMSPATEVFEWSSMLLYPAGYYARDLQFSPVVAFPHGWSSATSLTGRVERSDTVQYPTVDLDTLIDSPVMAGAHVSVRPVAGDAELDVFWDQASPSEIDPGQAALYGRLVEQAERLFGGGNYRHFNFLVKATDGDGPVLEHRRSSELRLPLSAIAQPPQPHLTTYDLVSHEYTHSWNGKSKRPYDLWQPEYSTPQQGSLLWVYEGLTEYWGIVLGARAGFASPQDALDNLAEVAAKQSHEAGRQWRTLLDSTTDNAAPVRRPKPWASYQRTEDFYYEGVLLWLQADAIIRTSSHGRKSLEGFAPLFFRLPHADDGVSVYTFKTLVDALQAYSPYAWEPFFRDHLLGSSPNVTAGLEQSGYTLVYTGEPTDYHRAAETSRFGGENTARRERDLSYSIGMTVGATGVVRDVLWGGPAFKAGLTVGTAIETVNGKPFAPDVLVEAVRSAAAGDGRIVLDGKAIGFPKHAEILWSGGLRYPHLQRNGGPALLDEILAPATP